MAPNIVEPLSLFTGPFSATPWPRAARAKGPGQGNAARLPSSAAKNGTYMSNQYDLAHDAHTGALQEIIRTGYFAHLLFVAFTCTSV